MNPFHRWLSVLVLVVLALPVGAQPYGLDQRTVVGSFLNGALPPAIASPAGWTPVVAFPNLTFNNAICFTPEPGTNRLYVCEREGKIYFFTNNANTASKTLFLDLTAKTQGYNDSGVMGMAFHPEYGVAGSTNRGYVYIYYSYSPSPVGPVGGAAPDNTRSYNRLSRFTVPDGSLIANPASELVLINQFDEHLWHNGGGMFFGPDGFLYLSNGDGGGVNDEFNHTQEINSGLFSGVLRIDVNKDPTKSHPIRRQPVSPVNPPGGWPATYTTNYYIPNDNPWVNPNGSVLEEFYAIGLRSPHRMTYDAASGRIWLGDVGQNSWEEVSVIEKGGNYQWAFLEGNHPNTNPSKAVVPSPLIGTSKPPVHEYEHINGNNCVIGGYVYRGTAHPSLYGKYIFGDNGSGRVWSMEYDGVNPATNTLLFTIPEGVYSLTSFGLDQNNELYMCVFGDGKQIYKIASVGAQPPPPPTLLSQTGAFTNLTTLAPSAALVPFDVNAPLWSDNANKFRWMVVPNNGAPYGATETIGFSSNGNWSFPTGTVLVKQFNLPLNDTNPAVEKRLETRFMVRATNGFWYGLTYKWRADNSDADLLPGSLNETNVITTATGVRTQVWYYPSRSDCLTCHNANSGVVLGPRTSQLNGDVFYPATGRTDNQLRTLSHIGMFNTTLNETNIPLYPKSANIANTNASPELRVRSYLDANCSHCHQPNGVRGQFDARFSTPLDNQGLINGVVMDPLGVVGARVVRPQNLAQSILYLRDNALGGIQMPPLAKNLVDTNYIQILTQWIGSLPITPDLPPGLAGVFGNTNTGVSSDNIYSGAPYINAAAFVASSNMAVAFMRAQVQGVTGRYKTALYADNNGEPGALIGTTTTVTNPATGWQTFGFNQPITLSSGETYWCAIWSDSASARVYYTSTTTGTLHWGQYNFSTIWPDPLVTDPVGGTYNYSIYAFSGVKPVFQGTPANRTIAELAVLTVTNRATDADLPAQGLTYYLLNPPAGAAISTNGVVTWTPSAAQGPSTNQIVTAATDGVFSITNTFQVIVTNANANIAPVANSQSVTNAEDTLLNLTLTGTDPDGPVMNFVVVTNPVHGVLSGSMSNLTYLPDTNYFGPDSLAFRVNDGSLTSTVAIVSIMVSNINDAPIAFSQAVTNQEDAGFAVTLTGADVDGPVANFVVVTNPLHGTLTGTAPNLTYTPAPDYFGPDSLAFKLNDGALTSAVATVSITLTGVNDAPFASNQSVTNLEDTEFALTLTGGDIDGPITSFVVVTNPVHGVLSGSAPNLTYLPNTNFFGADTLAFRVNDGSLTSTVALVSIVLSNVNDAPFASNQSVTNLEDTEFAVTLTGGDIDGPATSFVVVTNPVHGVLSGSAPNLTYLPDTNYFGSDTLAFRINDGSLTSTVALVSIVLSNVNDAPFAASQSLATDEDVTLAIALVGGDVDGPVTNYVMLSNPAHGTLTGAAPDLSYAPDTNYFGPDSFTFAINDGSLTSAVAIVSLLVTNVNDAPFAASQSLTTAEDAAFSIVLGGGDIDGPVTNYVVLSDPAHGTLTGAAPDLSYAPATNYFGLDSFTFAVNDGSLTSAVALVSLTVTNINDAPEAISDELLRWVSQGVTASTVLLLTNDVDADGDTLALLSVTNATPIGATLTQSNNVVVYQPAFGDTNAGSFNYIIADGNGGSATGLVSVAVQPDPVGDDVLGLTAASGSEVNISLSGIPGFTYTVQYTHSLLPPTWLNLTVDTADGLGQINVNDTMPEGSTNRFYRAVRGLVPNP